MAQWFARATKATAHFPVSGHTTLESFTDARQRLAAFLRLYEGIAGG